MSDAGGLIVGLLAAPLLLVVLLVAGVGYLALQGARLVGSLAVQGVQFAGAALTAGVRAASQAIAAAGTYAGSAIGNGVQWGSTLFDSTRVGERLRANTHAAYHTISSTRESDLVKKTGPNVLSSLDGALTPATPMRSAATLSGSLSVAATTASASDTVSATTAITPHQNSTDHQSAVAAMSRTQAVLTALAAETPVYLVAQQQSGGQLADVQVAMAKASDLLQTGNAAHASLIAGEAESLLTTAVHTAHQTLVRAERATIAATVGNSLEDLGYEVRAARVGDAVALVGRREHHTLALVAQPGGKLEIDMAGFEGDSCSQETTNLLEALRRNGLVITAEQITRHGKFEGGALIRKAQRRGQPLATALAELMAAPVAEAPVRRRTGTGGQNQNSAEADRLRQAKALLWGQSQSQTGGSR